MNDYQDVNDYQDWIELWDAKLEAAVGKYIENLLNGSFATTVKNDLIGEIWDYLILYNHLLNPDGIEEFSKALSIKIILELELDFPDMDASSSLWDRAFEKLNTEHQKMLRLIPDDTLLKEPDEGESPEEDVDASSNFFVRLKRGLNAQKQKMLRLIEEESPEEQDQPDDYLYLKENVQAAKNHSLPEIYEELFARPAAMLDSYYIGAVSELRDALIDALISEFIIYDKILKEDIDD